MPLYTGTEEDAKWLEQGTSKEMGDDEHKDFEAMSKEEICDGLTKYMGCFKWQSPQYEE